MDSFIKHAALIFQQDGCTIEQARFKAWCEGPDGYSRRLEEEHSKEHEWDDEDQY